jgi:hypothetical protein
MDQAHRAGRSRVDLRLGANYLKIRNRRRIYSELERIARIVRNRLPDRASRVTVVDVYFGDKLGLQIKLPTPAADTPKAVQ